MIPLFFLFQVPIPSLSFSSSLTHAIVRRLTPPFDQQSFALPPHQPPRGKDKSFTEWQRSVSDLESCIKSSVHTIRGAIRDPDVSISIYLLFSNHPNLELSQHSMFSGDCTYEGWKQGYFTAWILPYSSSTYTQQHPGISFKSVRFLVRWMERSYGDGQLMFNFFSIFCLRLI